MDENQETNLEIQEELPEELAVDETAEVGEAQSEETGSSEESLPEQAE